TARKPRTGCTKWCPTTSCGCSTSTATRSKAAWTTACGARRRRTDRNEVGRWRPPGEKSTALVTAAGHARLKSELDDLGRVRRHEAVRAPAAAAAEGDRSENAEYAHRKKQLGEIDRRVRYLSKRLETLRVVDTAPADRGAVFFGARVE